MSTPAWHPSQLDALVAGSRSPEPTPHDHGEGAVASRFPGSATWVEPGQDHPSGHGRGELVVSAGAVTFELRSGERAFAHRGDTVAFTHTPLAGVVVLQDGETRVRVTVSALAGHTLQRALSAAGVLA